MQEHDAEYEVEEKLVERDRLRFLSRHIVDAAFLVFLLALVEQYYSFISAYKVPVWDGAVYLTNARNWLTNTPLYQVYRPPLISWIIAGVWAITGENWQNAEYLSPLFGIGSALILYLTLRRGKGAVFAFAVVALTMLSPQVFYYSTQILTESLSLLFLAATLCLVKSERKSSWLLAGFTAGLTFASRYPILVPAGIIVLFEAYARRNWHILTRAVLGAIPVLAAVISAMFLKTGAFQIANPANANFAALSPYYLLNSISAWGWIFLLVPMAFVFRKTYSDRYNYAFVGWFVLPLIFWSLNATRDLRFTIQLTPAVDFLAILTLETFIRNSEPIRQFLRRELIFLPKMRAIRTT